MGSKNIPLYRIFWDEADVESITSVIRRGFYWSSGPTVEEFEGKISDFVGRRYGVAFNSGSSALQALLLSYDFEPGSEVIVPSFTFISSVNSVLHVGAAPIFADIEEKYLGLDPASVAERVTRKTKAILPTHYGGCPCKIDELRRLAEDHGLVLIEDSAEALGAEIRSKGKAGSFGDSAIFSFSGNKVLTTGEGGLVVTDSERIYRMLKLIRSHGDLTSAEKFSSGTTETFVRLGCNWRMSDITASVGLSQFRKLDRLVGMRIENAKYLSSKLRGIRGVTPPEIHEDRINVFQMYTVKVDEALDRNALKDHLEGKGITCKVYFEPIHQNEYYKKNFGCPKLPVTEEVSKKVLTLPMYPSLTKDEMDYIVDEIYKFRN
jgi:perosamine synthetase